MRGDSNQLSKRILYSDNSRSTIFSDLFIFFRMQYLIYASKHKILREKKNCCASKFFFPQYIAREDFLFLEIMFYTNKFNISLKEWKKWKFLSTFFQGSPPISSDYRESLVPWTNLICNQLILLLSVKFIAIPIKRKWSFIFQIHQKNQAY